MKTKEAYISPDGTLKLIVVEGQDGTIAVGFEGGVWHTHPDLISYWLPVAEAGAVQFLIDAIVCDQLPILFKARNGEIAEAWISDNLPETLRLYCEDEWSFRLWSSTAISADQALKADADIARLS